VLIDLSRLKTGIDEYTNIDLTYSFSQEELKNTEIISLDNVSIKGYINYNYGKYEINLNVLGEFMLPCSIS